MFLDKPALDPRLVFALASSLCACGMAQDAPAKPPDAGSPAPQSAPASTPPAPEPVPAAKAPEEAATPAAAKDLPVSKPADGKEQAAPAPAEPDLMSGIGKNAPSQNVTINLINRMVKKGLLTKEEAAELIAQSEQDSVIARNQTRDDAQIAAQMVIQQAVTQKVIPNLDPLIDDSSVRVTYIPETVKKQIKDDLRQEVLAEAREKNWTGPKAMPEWVSKFRVKGDVRIRYENDLLPGGNDNTGAFPDFNAINTGAPFDVAGTVFSPQLNVDQDRTRVRIRARIAAEVDLGENFTAGLRIGTGQDNQPVSTNQSLGKGYNGQGGNFSKYAIWLDRGFLKYEVGPDPDRHLAISAGRFDNPFYTVSELVWDEDVGFDGIGLTARYRVSDRVVPFLAGGAYPIFNTDFNFASNQPAKFKSTDKYLYAVQLGTDVKLTDKFQAKVAGAYYYFDGAQGKLSTPYTPLTASDAGDTDTTRPLWAQKGNTYMALRNIVPDATNNFGTINQWQYFGLASKFRPVVFSGQINYNGFEPVQVSLLGEYVKNLGFDRNNIAGKAVNNFSAATAANPNGAFAGGDTAWFLGLRAGHAVLQQRGNWQAGVNYRYVESDAVIDGFNDSDFGVGGTNQKGYTLWGTYATSARTSLTVRWMSASEVAGPPLKTDVFIIDFSGRF